MLDRKIVQKKKLWSDLDMPLVVIALLLSIIGIINLYSATHTVGDTSGVFSSVYKQQILWLGIGFILMIICIVVDYRLYLRFAYPIYILSLLLVALTLLIGSSAKGSSRWLELGIFKLQPSEFIKITLVFVLAKYFHDDKNSWGYNLKQLIKPLVLLLIPFALIVAQPDLGTGMLLMFIFVTVVLFVKVDRHSILILIITGIISAGVGWQYVLKDYQKNRVLTFMDPMKDPKGTGYNAIQSKIAVGSGKFWGKGFMRGTQSQFNFLPEHHTDFIFSVFSEEYGLLGCIVLISLYVSLFLWGLRVSSHAKEKFGILLGIGLISILFWHTFVNVGMVIGILPIVGVPLPFLSYGGSSMLTSMIIIGILGSISIRKYMF